jgi:hypothetical protein
MASDDELQYWVSAAMQPQTAVQLVSAFGEQRRPIVYRSLLWLIKLGLVRAVY